MIAPGRVAEAARGIVRACLDNGFPQQTIDIQQVLCVAEEVGEFVGAFRRWKGLARRPGPFEDVQSELADVVISAYTAADALGIDLDAAIEAKLAVIFSRGWRAAGAS